MRRTYLNSRRRRRAIFGGTSRALRGGFADNIRFPFIAVGMHVDVNRGKWHGKNSGNYD